MAARETENRVKDEFKGFGLSLYNPVTFHCLLDELLVCLSRSS